MDQKTIQRPSFYTTVKKTLSRRNAEIDELLSEVFLLSSYSTDTIYRLRYEDMQYEYVSPSVTRLLGFTPEEMKKINLRSLILETRMVTNGMKPVMSFGPLESSRQKGDVSKWQADYLIRTKDGRKIWVSDVSYPWFDEKGVIIGSIGSLRDITDRIAAEEEVKEELLRLAHTDPLTGLANRREFLRRLDHELKRLKRKENDMSILLIGIDQSNPLSDAQGNTVSDVVLREAGNLVKRCLRETDLPARLNNEQFGVVLPDASSTGAYWVAERICSKITQHRFFADSQKTIPVKCTVSIGVSAVDLDRTLNPDTLYKMAETRLYIAKNTGCGHVSVDEIVQYMH